MGRVYAEYNVITPRTQSSFSPSVVLCMVLITQMFVLFVSVCLSLSFSLFYYVFLT